MTTCRVCSSNSVQKLLDLGMLPVCHRFLKSANEQEFKHNFILGFCNECSIVQLINSFPAPHLKPIYDWVTYREPEEHLHRIAEMLAKLLNKDAKICGISFKDDSTLERLKKHGFHNILRLDVQKDLDADSPYAGIETIQNLFTVKQAKKITHHYGKFDLVIARHILEHAYDIFEFMNAIKEFLNPNGFALFEVPDYTKPFELYDYSTLWEEHILYFTPYTFKNFFNFVGFSLEQFELFPYPIENSLIAIVQPSQKIKMIFDREIIELGKKKAMSFSNEFAEQKKHIIDVLSKYSKNNSKIAVFGAGHSSCLLINIFDIAKYINCVIDDNQNKQGLLMPGSHLPIVGSSELINRNIKLCVFSINPNLEEKIIAKNSAFIQNGGKFLSFCPVSPYSIFSDTKNKSDFNFRKFDSQVYYVENQLATVGKKEIQFLKDKLINENLNRIRLCTHKDINDAIHEMFVILRKDIYIRPHKHLNKSESFHLIEGTANVVIFDNDGNIEEVIKLGNYDSMQKMYYRMDFALFHTVIVLSDFLVFKETTEGPFRKIDTIYAPWAPDERETSAGKAYMEQIKKSVDKIMQK